MHVVPFLPHSPPPPLHPRRGSRGGAKGAAAPPPPSFFCSLLFTLFIVTPTILIYIQAGVKIVIITIIRIITFITNACTHAN